MAVKAISVEEKLMNLYQLQLIDSNIDEIEILKGELPMEVLDLEDEIMGLDKRLAKLDDAIAEMVSDINNHKHNIKEFTTLVERYEKQLEEVKNNREFDALSKEIELQRLEIQLSEKKIRDIEKLKEVKDDSRAKVSEKLEMKKTNLSNKKVELDKIIEKTTKEEEKFRKKSATASKGIEERLLESYNRIRTRYRNGLSVVTVQRDACGGCFNRIPPQVQIEIGTRKNIIACEHCGRVLIDDDLAAEVDKTVN